MLRNQKVSLLICSVLCLVLLIGCAGPKVEPEGNGKEAPAERMQLVLATGGTAGTYYPLGGAMGQIISDATGTVNITAQATGASVENMNLLASGDVDLVLVQNDIADYAYNGTEFFDKKITNFSAIARIYPEHIQVLTRKDLPINSIYDYKGHRVSVGAPGSGNEANARQICEVYGLSYIGDKKDFEPHYLSYAEGADHFKDHQVDVLQYTTGAPNSSIQDIALLHDIKFVPITGKEKEELKEKYPFYADEIIPAGMYKGVNEDVETVAVQAILAVHNDIPEDIVYDITKALFEKQPEIAEAHFRGNDIQLDRALDGITVPLHPGAERYYKEQGVVK